MPITLDMRGFSSKQFLGQYNLKVEQLIVNELVNEAGGIKVPGRFRASYLGQCFAGFWYEHIGATVVSHVMALTVRKGFAAHLIMSYFTQNVTYL